MVQPVIYENIQLPPRPTDRPTWVPEGGIWGINFVDDTSWNASYEFSRASTALMLDTDGVYQSFEVDEFRQINNIGATLEDELTNYIKNNTMAGAAAGTPGTLPTGNWDWSGGAGTITREINAIGVENGIPYMDIKFTGSVDVGNATFLVMEQNVSTTNGDTWTIDSFVGLTGTAPTSVTFVINDPSGTPTRFDSPNFVSSLTENLTRQNYTFTVGGSVTSITGVILRIGVSAGTVDFTIRVGAPTLTKLSKSTSPILTSGTIATRSADTLVVTPNIPGSYALTAILEDDSIQVISEKISGPITVDVSKLNGIVKYIYANDIPVWLTNLASDAIMGWDFQSNRKFDLTSSFSRSSSGLMQNATNNYVSFDTDELRQINGFGGLLESSSTRVTPYPNTPYTNWAKPSSITATQEEGTFLGVFEDASRVASVGQVWNRTSHATNQTLSQPSYGFTAIYAAGTSGQVRITIRDTTSAAESILSGSIGSIGSTSTSSAGTFVEITENHLGDGIYACIGKFLPAIPGNQFNFGIGPNTAISGDDIIVIGGWMETTRSSSLNIDTPSGQSVRAADQLELTLNKAGNYVVNAVLEDDSIQTIASDASTTVSIDPSQIEGPFKALVCTSEIHMPSWLTDLSANAVMGWDFTTNRKFDLTGTISQSATSYMSNLSNYFVSFGANNLRQIDTIGALLEPEFTNAIPNSSLVGAAISETEELDGLPTGWARTKIDGTEIKGQILDVGTWFGLPAITIRLWGTSNITDAQIIINDLNQLPAVQNDKIMQSVITQRTAGSVTNVSFRLRMTEQLSGTYLNKQLFSFNPITTPTVNYNSFTVGQATTNQVLMTLEINCSGAFDVTFKLAAPQLIKTSVAFPPSPILTSTAPITRSADLFNLTLQRKGQYTLKALLDDNSIQTISTGVANSYILNSTNLNRPTVKAIWAE